MKEAVKKAKSQFDKEHVTPFIKKNSNLTYNLFNSKDYSSMRITLDYPKDFQVFDNIMHRVKGNIYISSKKIEKM